MENALKAVALAFGMVAASAAHAEEVLLSCWGTVEVIQQGKQVNPVDEKYSIAVAVDIAKKTITIDGVRWPITGDASRETIVAMAVCTENLNPNVLTMKSAQYVISKMAGEFRQVYARKCPPCAYGWWSLVRTPQKVLHR